MVSFLPRPLYPGDHLIRGRVGRHLVWALWRREKPLRLPVIEPRFLDSPVRSQVTSYKIWTSHNGGGEGSNLLKYDYEQTSIQISTSWEELAASMFRLVTFCCTTLNAANSCQTLVPVHTASYPRNLESACTISFLFFLESFNHAFSWLPLSSFRSHHVLCTSSSLSSGHNFHPRWIVLRRNTLGWTWNSLTQNNFVLK